MATNNPRRLSLKGILLYENVLLLSANNESKPSRELLSKNMFDVPNKTAFVHVMYFLLHIIDPEKCKDIPWPLSDKISENKFRSEVLKIVKDLRMTYPESQIPHIVPSLFLSPGREIFIAFMLKVSTFALFVNIKKIYGNVALYHPISHSKDDNLAAKIHVQELLFRYHMERYKDHERKLETLKTSVHNANSQIKLEVAQLVQEIQEAFKKLHTKVKNLSCTLERKKRLLDLKDDTVIPEWNAELAVREDRVRTLRVKVEENNNMLKVFCNKVKCLKARMISPVLLDGSTIFLNNEDLRMHCFEDGILVLHKFFQLVNSVLLPLTKQFKTLSIPNINPYLPELKMLRTEQEKLEEISSNNILMLNTLHTRLLNTGVDDQNPDRKNHDGYAFKATPPFCFFDKDGTMSCDITEEMSLTPVAGGYRNIFEKKAIKISTHSIGSLLIPSAVKKPNQKETSGLASSMKTSNTERSERKKAPEIRRNLLSHLTTKISPKDSVPQLQTEVRRNWIHEGTRKPPAKEHLFAQSQAICSLTPNRNYNIGNYPVKLREKFSLSSSVLPNEDVLDEVVRQMVKSTPRFEDECQTTINTISGEWSPKVQTDSFSFSDFKKIDVTDGSVSEPLRTPDPELSENSVRETSVRRSLSKDMCNLLTLSAANPDTTLHKNLSDAVSHCTLTESPPSFFNYTDDVSDTEQEEIVDIQVETVADLSFSEEIADKQIEKDESNSVSKEEITKKQEDVMICTREDNNEKKRIRKSLTLVIERYMKLKAKMK